MSSSGIVLTPTNLPSVASYDRLYELMVLILSLWRAFVLIIPLWRESIDVFFFPLKSICVNSFPLKSISVKFFPLLKHRSQGLVLHTWSNTIMNSFVSFDGIRNYPMLSIEHTGCKRYQSVSMMLQNTCSQLPRHPASNTRYHPRFMTYSQDLPRASQIRGSYSRLNSAGTN